MTYIGQLTKQFDKTPFKNIRLTNSLVDRPINVNESYMKQTIKTHVNESSAVYAFSADPITNGHINIVERMATSFARCVVGIGRNPQKNYLFDLEERKHLAEQALAHLPNVEVHAFTGMVVDFAYEHNAKVIVKGVRTATDMEYEQTLHQVGASQELGIDTYILFADPQLAHVSSSVVKGMQLEHGFIHRYVPPIVKAALESRLSKQLVIGLTGDIASGKSTLAKQLTQQGDAIGLRVHNIDLDKLGHQIIAGDNIGELMHRKITNALIAHFGKGIISNGKVSRTLLANYIFDSPNSRHFLNTLMTKPMSVLLRKTLKDKQGLILLNGALLADLDLLALCNYRCILCSVEKQEQMTRLNTRGLSNIDAEKRLSAQFNGEQKRDFIDTAIHTAGFGKVWQYDTKDRTDLPYLEQLLDDCEEFKWKY